MHESVTLVNRATNDLLQAFSLEPGLAFREIVVSHKLVFGNVIVSSHKGVENTELVELHGKVIGGAAEKSGQITSAKNDTRNAKGQELVD